MKAVNGPKPTKDDIARHALVAARMRSNFAQAEGNNRNKAPSAER